LRFLVKIDIFCPISSNILMFMKLTLEALEVIDAIEHKGSFAAAAAVLNRVPSAISYTVQKLEQDLGVTLFQKEGRRAALTSAGRHLVEQGRLLLTAADELVAGTQQVATGWEPRLRIAVDTQVPVEDVLLHVAALHQEQPTIEVSLSSEVLAGTWEALIENRVDLVIGGVGEAPRHHGVRCESWREYRHVFVAAPDHPLSSADQPIAPETAERYRGITIPDSSRNTTPLSRGLLHQQTAISVPNMAAKLAAHRLGLGVGFVPEDLAAEDIAAGRLVKLAVADAQENEPAMLGWKTSNRGQALGFMLERLRQAT
jgi:DNA-binding transcriptional LysR family regulator